MTSSEIDLAARTAQAQAQTLASIAMDVHSIRNIAKFFFVLTLIGLVVGLLTVIGMLKGW